MSEESKNFIKLAIQELEVSNPSQDSINSAVNYIKLAIQTIVNSIDKIKTYSINIPDSKYKTENIKIGLDNNIVMEVGDDLGMIAHLIPHNYRRSNPYCLTTNNKDIVDVEGMILTAKSEGEAIITVSTLDNSKSDSITVKVVKPYEFNILPEEIYNLNPLNFNLIENDYSYEVSLSNNNAIRAILTYAKNNNYKKIVFPQDKVYYIDGHDTIYLKNDLIIDLNGSKIIIAPNPYIYGYEAINVQENNKEYNICPKGYINSKGEELEKSIKNNFKISEWTDENGKARETYQYFYNTYTYNLNYNIGGEEGVIYLKNNINVVDSFSEYYTNAIVKGETYKLSLNLFKHKPFGATNDATSNTISVIAELYKNNSLLKEQNIANYSWRKNNQYITTINKTFVIDEADYIKIKITGLSDQYPIDAALEDMYIALDNSNYNQLTENIIFQNGSILGERYVYEEDGITEVKNTIFNNTWGKLWTDKSYDDEGELEGNNSLVITKGKNIYFKNMNIENSVGFNIAIDNVSNKNAVEKYYPNANGLEYGYIDENGSLVDDNNFARTSEFIEVNITQSPYFIVTDATFVHEFYYGYRSRLINVYCYDENKNLLESKMFKLRHGMLKAPKGTKYLKLCVPIMTQLGEELINKGNSDFNNCIFAIKFMNETKNIKFENCNISNNYSCGMALSGYNITIDGCTFNNNVGRMPWCDIDCEDGWLRMQNITFRNNKFQSYYGLIMCAGQNFVFKNNEISNFTGYAQEQLFKWYNNKFLNTGYGSSFKCQQDCYMINNEFAEGMNYLTGKSSSELEYEIYTVNNKFLGNNTISSGTYMYDNEYSGDVRVNSTKEDLFTNGFHLDKAPNITSLSYNVPEVNNGEFNILPVKLLTDCVFNNCSFARMPNTLDAANKNHIATFNECTLYNPKKSDYYIINDNCNVINGVIDNLIYDNLVTDSLIATIQDVQGEYDVINNNININNNFTIVYKIKHLVSGTNYGVDIFSDTNFIIKSLWDKGGLSFTITSYDSDDKPHRELVQKSANLEADIPYVFYTITYNKENKTLKGYVNDNEVLLSYTVPEGNYLKGFSSIKINSAIAYNASVDKMYIYNKVLSEEEIIRNYNVLI